MIRKRPRLYLETSVWNFLFAEDALEKRESTIEFFRELEQRKYEAFISDVVIREIGRTEETERSNLLLLLNKYNPAVLPSSEEVASFAEKLVTQDVIPERFRDDALHISYAVVNELDILASWNMRHIVKLRTKVMVNALAEMEGFKRIIICTPEEVIGYG